MPRVMLIHMPWAAIDVAPIQTGILKSALEAAEIEADDLCANVELLPFAGAATYMRIAQGDLPVLLGEWLFAAEIQQRSAGGDPVRSHVAYLDALAGRGRMPAGLRSTLLDLRERAVPRYLDRLVSSRDWKRYDVIGFSCVFSQAVPSLALARRIRALAPDAAIVLGGAQCDSPMGEAYLRAFPWIDLVVAGPGEKALPEIARAAAAGVRDYGTIGGVASRGPTGEVRGAKPRPPVELDRLPIPSYATYFDAIRAHPIEPRIAIEASRGCWWGQKHHCTFCGIAPETMVFRAKSPGVVLSEMMELSRRHGVLDFIFTDYIMDHRYFGSFLPELEALQCGFHCFFELKSNVTREQMEALGRAGVRMVQPGIESFSAHVLELMRKGSTGLQNLQLLRWCRELALRPVYNILTGFPGEEPADYEAQIDLAQSVLHLQPPEQIGPLVVHRYSPLFTGTAPVNLANVRPRDDYRFVFHPDEVETAEIAYEHETDPPEGAAALQPLYDRLAEVIARWRERWTRDPPRLDLRLGPGFVSIEDTRGEQPRIHTIEGTAMEIYLAIWERPRTIEALQHDLRHDGRAPDAESISGILSALASLRLVWCESGRWLALAVAHAVHRNVAVALQPEARST